MPIETSRPRAIESFSTMPGHLTRRVYQVSTALFAEECGGLDLTPVQFAALVAIDAHPRIDATRLSEVIYFDRIARARGPPAGRAGGAPRAAAAPRAALRP
jgi:hypothetical protein